MTLRHIVMFKMDATTDNERARRAATLAAALEALPSHIEQIRSLSVGANNLDRPGNWDLLLTVDVADEAALDAYRDHPEHVKIMQLTAQTVAERCAIDLIIEDASSL